MHRNLGWAENRRKRLTTVQKEQGPFPAGEREARGPQSPCLGHLRSPPLGTRGPQALSSVEGLQESTQLHFPQGRRRHGAPAPCGLCDHCPGTAARVCPAPGLLVPTITVPLSEISRKRAIKRQVLFGEYRERLASLRVGTECVALRVVVPCRWDHRTGLPCMLCTP